MNEQELLDSVENANTVEEVWEVVSKAGVDRASFDAMIDVADKEQDDEINETDLEDVNGGSIIGGLIAGYLASRIIKKVKKIRKQRYQLGYDEEIMSDNRLSGTCENKK